MSNWVILNGELYHHGIKGQKWGVRRFQNADGSLKPAGAKRYGGYEDEGSTKKKQLSNELIELSKNGMTIKQETEVQNKVAEIISDDLKNRYLDTLNKTLKSSYDDYKKNRKNFDSVVNEIIQDTLGDHASDSYTYQRAISADTRGTRYKTETVTAADVLKSNIGYFSNFSTAIKRSNRQKRH